MNTEIKLVHCPRCGSVNLDGVCDDRMSAGKALFWGTFLGIFSAFRNKPKAFWRCLECGETFPME